ncbi:hypothetical protein BU23DRAFT_557119 [Bimuria novae-zelandiae CBS 107.79]|uniref:Uncharacterized protein n=1 Tax=Bimuria novae-zelandiae CBS 107.79 TaxID=1447943 RepID=A0A6A5V1V9_9PLEO|nr:hypothetical protein BU23DRAFT_557119 [Bimuria novae-zelandiae CBS 107.79]
MGLTVLAWSLVPWPREMIRGTDFSFPKPGKRPLAHDRIRSFWKEIPRIPLDVEQREADPALANLSVTDDRAPRDIEYTIPPSGAFRIPDAPYVTVRRLRPGWDENRGTGEEAWNGQPRETRDAEGNVAYDVGPGRPFQILGAPHRTVTFHCSSAQANRSGDGDSDDKYDESDESDESDDDDGESDQGQETSPQLVAPPQESERLQPGLLESVNLQTRQPSPPSNPDQTSAGAEPGSSSSSHPAAGQDDGWVEEQPGDDEDGYLPYVLERDQRMPEPPKNQLIKQDQEDDGSDGYESNNTIIAEPATSESHVDKPEHDEPESSTRDVADEDAGLRKPSISSGTTNKPNFEQPKHDKTDTSTRDVDEDDAERRKPSAGSSKYASDNSSSSSDSPGKAPPKPNWTGWFQSTPQAEPPVRSEPPELELRQESELEDFWFCMVCGFKVNKHQPKEAWKLHVQSRTHNANKKKIRGSWSQAYKTCNWQCQYKCA